MRCIKPRIGENSSEGFGVFETDHEGHDGTLGEATDAKCLRGLSLLFKQLNFPVYHLINLLSTHPYLPLAIILFCIRFWILWDHIKPRMHHLTPSQCNILHRSSQQNNPGILQIPGLIFHYKFIVVPDSSLTKAMESDKTC